MLPFAHGWSSYRLWIKQRAAVLMYDQAINSALPVRERLPESLTSTRAYLHFVFWAELR